MSSPWEAHCTARERTEYTLLSLVAAVGFPTYVVFDVFLEPGHLLRFGLIRCLGTLASVLGLVAVRRARTLRGMRLALWLPMAFDGALVATMLPVAHHFTAYLLNYSVYFWAMVLVSMPPRMTATLLAWQSAALATVFVVSRGDVPASDLANAGFFLGLAGALTLGGVASRAKANRRAFDASLSLAERNRELEAAMTSLHDAQARLVAQEKQSALGRMLAGLSHEINNPVNVIKNNLEPVREHVAELMAVVELARTVTPATAAALAADWEQRDIAWRATDLEDALGAMHDAVSHIRQVHADLRAFIRGDAPDMVAADLNEGLRATVGLVGRRLAKDIHLELALDTLPAISCQPGQLNQVWLNLIQNAVEAVGPAGTVTVRSRVTGDGVEVSVADTGPGVSTAFRARLFEPFATTKGPGSGTGLGLATSFQIAQRHGGRIYLDDNHRGGARFVVELPSPPGGSQHVGEQIQLAG